MQSTEPSISNINTAFDYYPTFTAWEHSEQPSVSLKLLNRHLSYLQNQYRNISKRQQPVPKEQMTKINRRKSQFKVSFFEENLVKLPEVKKYKRGQSIGTLAKSDKQNINTKGTGKQTSTPLNCSRGEDKKRVQKRRSGSQFSQLRDYLKGEVNQKDIFLHKNKIANISKTINLQTLKHAFYLKQQPFEKPSRLSLVRKIEKVMPVRS